MKKNALFRTVTDESSISARLQSLVVSDDTVRNIFSKREEQMNIVKSKLKQSKGAGQVISIDDDSPLGYAR